MFYTARTDFSVSGRERHRRVWDTTGRTRFRETELLRPAGRTPGRVTPQMSDVVSVNMTVRLMGARPGVGHQRGLGSDLKGPICRV